MRLTNNKLLLDKDLCTRAPLFAVHFPFPVNSVRASVHSQQHFSLPPTLCSHWNLCLALSIMSYVHYIFSTTRTYFKQTLFFSSTSICTLKINHLYYGLYWTRSHSFIGFRGCGTAVLLPNKRSDREVQPLASLYPTIRPSPWRQVRKNIHSSVWTPGPT